MKIKRESMIIWLGESGGYEDGYCAICHEGGCLKDIKHKKDCPVDSEAKYLEVKKYEQ